MSLQEVRIPDLGDATDVEIIEIYVKEGQTIAIDDPLVVLESDKASMDVPAPLAGTVASISCQLGDTVETGDLILTLEAAVASEPKGPPEVEISEQDESVQEADETQETGSKESSEPVVTNQDSTAETVLEVRVPDVGEAKDVVVIEILVKEQDSVNEGDPLVVIESDKASMELPAPVAGVIERLFIELEQTVETDTLIATLRGRFSSPATEKETQQDESTEGGSQETKQTSVGTTEIKRPSAIRPESSAGSGKRNVYAGPAVRRLARELGVDLTKVQGSADKGRITKDDVKAYVKEILTASGGQVSLPEVRYPDFTQFGDVELKPLTRMQSAGASNLVRSWLNVVHVTEFENIDVTELENARSRFNQENENKPDNVRLTPLPFIVKACAQILKEYPQFNSSIQADLSHLILKKYVNIGFAVDTDDGLVVPVIRDAIHKNLIEIATEIVELSDAARSRRLRTDDISGATFTISSLGRLGGTGFGPIVNAPEVAILGVARLETRPVWDGSQFNPRPILPVSLSYDHRAINGAEAGRFLGAIATRLADETEKVLK